VSAGHTTVASLDNSQVVSHKRFESGGCCRSSASACSLADSLPYLVCGCVLWPGRSQTC
jgi:hypothetical protein